MDIDKKKVKKEPLKQSYKAIKNFTHDKKEYRLGDIIRLTKQQAKAAKKNNLI